ncbi:MAG: hypothetical protein WCH42_03245 [Actinomycetes bacterium]
MADDDIIAELDKLKAEKVISEKTAQIYLSQVRDYVPPVSPLTPHATKSWSRTQLTMLGIGIVALALVVGVLLVHK